MRTDQGKQFLRVDQVARELDISKRQVYYMIESGAIEAIRPTPRCTRVSGELVEKLKKNK